MVGGAQEAIEGRFRGEVMALVGQDGHDRVGLELAKRGALTRARAASRSAWERRLGGL